MTHQDECPAIADLTALLIEHGPAAMASLLRLASAVLSEISDDWETERTYLNMEAR
jgi:hypothetical protein